MAVGSSAFRRDARSRPVQAGFTLMELVVVMVVAGILSSVVVVFIRGPIEGYFSTVRRAGQTDTADFALRRIARDIRTALPNSVRSAEVRAGCTTGSDLFLEYLEVRSGARYRASPDGGTDPLDVTSAADSSFDVLGAGIEVAAGDSIVVYNTGQAGADAYAGDNRRTYSGAPGTQANLAYAGGKFPRHSDSFRAHIVAGPVTFACDAANGTLWRFAGYPIQACQPAGLDASGQLITAGGPVGGARVATGVVCAADAGNLGSGFELRRSEDLVLMRIQLKDAASGEGIGMFRAVHIDNVP